MLVTWTATWRASKNPFQFLRCLFPFLSSTNVGLEEMLYQHSEKRSSVSRTVFVKGRQDMLDDVVSLQANIMVLGRFWIKFMGNDELMFPYVLRQLIGLVNVLTSTKFRNFAAMMTGVCPYLAHTLIVNIFNVSNGFVELAKNPHVIRELKATGHIDIKNVKVPTLIMNQLLEKLQLCIATGSPDMLFARPPNSFAVFCPVLAHNGVNNWSPLSRSGGQESGGRRNNGGRLDHWGPRNVWDTPPSGGNGRILRGGGTGDPVDLVFANG